MISHNNDRTNPLIQTSNRRGGSLWNLLDLLALPLPGARPKVSLAISTSPPVLGIPLLPDPTKPVKHRVNGVQGASCEIVLFRPMRSALVSFEDGSEPFEYLFVWRAKSVSAVCGEWGGLGVSKSPNGEK
jgi:hypothetical protein